jgi:hypothetical protein
MLGRPSSSGNFSGIVAAKRASCRRFSPLMIRWAAIGPARFPVQRALSPKSRPRTPAERVQGQRARLGGRCDAAKMPVVHQSPSEGCIAPRNRHSSPIAERDARIQASRVVSGPSTPANHSKSSRAQAKRSRPNRESQTTMRPRESPMRPLTQHRRQLATRGSKKRQGLPASVLQDQAMTKKML